MSQGLAEMLAARPSEEGGGRNQQEAEESNSRSLAESSLREAHKAMMREDYAAAHDHMADWVEHHKKSDYNAASPGQSDMDDDHAGALIVLQPKAGKV
jgi:hypothetical protein